jgi:hypothetical protein
MSKQLNALFRHCEGSLDSKHLEDLAWYDRRPTIISPKSFFRAYAWALLVTGMSRKGAETWAANTGFWSIFTMRQCALHAPSTLIQRVGVTPKTTRAQKLRAIHAMGRALSGRTSHQVAREYFLGERRTPYLSALHIPRLDAIPWIGVTNARFIIRNLDGEGIKDDRWILKIMQLFSCTLSDLEKVGKDIGWKSGRVDLVLWLYCEQEIRKVQNVKSHFAKTGLLVAPPRAPVGRVSL